MDKKDKRWITVHMSAAFFEKLSGLAKIQDKTVQKYALSILEWFVNNSDREAELRQEMTDLKLQNNRLLKENSNLRRRCQKRSYCQRLWNWLSKRGK